MTSQTQYYSLENLAQLRTELARLEPGNRSGGNPDKNVVRMKQLRSSILLIESELKRQGVVACTPEESLRMALDRETVGRRKGCCVEMDGQWYRIRYIGRDEDRNWQWRWESIPQEATAEPGSYIHSKPQSSTS